MEKVVQIYHDIKASGGNPLKWLVADIDMLYRLSTEEQQALKTCLMQDSFRHHYQNNQYYRELCKEQNISPDDIKSFDDLVRIPVIPVTKYKSADSHQLLSKPITEIEHEMRSTGTSGVPSVYRRCHETMDNTVTAIYSLFRSMFKISGGAGLILCPSPEDIPEMAMVKVFNFFTGLLDCSRYMIRKDSFPIDDAVKQLADWKGNFTRYIVGPPFLIHRFIAYLKENNLPLKMDSDSLVIMMGGWKRFSGEMIAREELAKDIEKWLAIPATQIRDMYGLVEANVLAVEDEFHQKHVAPYIHFSIRDPNDISKEIPDGDIGQLVILDPLSISTPGMLLTEDLVRLRTDQRHSWRNSQRLEFIMRTQTAQEFGCCAVNLEKKMHKDEKELFGV